LLQRVGHEALLDLQQYLQAHYHENILLLSDLHKAQGIHALGADALALVGYRVGGRVIAAQGFYRYGRWMPHSEDADALDAMIADMLPRHVRWIMGVRRVVDPLLRRLTPLGFQLGYDEHDYLSYVEQRTLFTYDVEGIRRATLDDLPAVANLRCAFEGEYFGVPEDRIDPGWCFAAAQRYIAAGTYVAERGGHVVAMVAVEASIPELTQIGAVYTQKAYRGNGLAKGVVSALCQEQLALKERVTLTVRTDNQPALAAYAALGFQRWDDYRMARFR
jgi:uncharacterized protein